MNGRYRVDWYPGEDRLRAVCHCHATRIGEDPAELWQWLLNHPAGHDRSRIETGL